MGWTHSRDARPVRRRRAMLVLFSLCGLAILVSLYHWVFGDALPLDLTEFRMARRVVADKDNGFALVDSRPDEIYWPIEAWDLEPQPWAGPDAWSRSAAEGVLARNAPVLERFDEACRRPDFQAPCILDSLDDAQEPDFHTLGGLVATLAWHLAETGRVEESLAEAGKLVEFGHRLQGAQGGAGLWCAGLHFKELGLACAFHVAERCHPASLRSTLQRWKRCRDHPTGLRDVIRSSASWLSRSIDRIAQGDREFLRQVSFEIPELGVSVNSGYSDRNWGVVAFKPHRTKRLVARGVHEILRSMSAGSATAKSSSVLRDIEQKMDSIAGWVNASGLWLAHHEIKGLYRIASGRADRELRFEGCRVLIAIKTFRGRHGRLPGTLVDLVPDILDEIPRVLRDEIRPGESWPDRLLELSSELAFEMPGTVRLLTPSSRSGTETSP